MKLLLALGVAKYIKSYKIHFVVQYATDHCQLEHDNYKTISAHLGSPISCYINNLHGAFIFLLSVFPPQWGNRKRYVNFTYMGSSQIPPSYSLFTHVPYCAFYIISKCALHYFPWSVGQYRSCNISHHPWGVHLIMCNRCWLYRVYQAQ